MNKHLFSLSTTHNFWLSVNSNSNKELSNRENLFRIQLGQREISINVSRRLLWPIIVTCILLCIHLSHIYLTKSSLCSLDFKFHLCHLVNILHVALWLHSSFFPHMLLINPIYWLIELLRRCLSSRINIPLLASWYCVNWLCFSVQPYFNKPLTVPQNALLCVRICQQSTFLVAQRRSVF